jgi:hypothetical protein
VPVVAGSVSAAKTPKVELCHLDQVLGTYSLNVISASGLAKHLAHGDIIPGEGVLDANCQPVVAARVFARAFADSNGNHTYDADVDDLFTELVDTTGDGLLDAGDTVRTIQYPVDFVGGTAPYGVVDHVISAVEAQAPGLVGVAVDAPAGFTRYSWIRIAGAEAFDEYTITGIDIHSGYQDAFASASDDIRVSSVSPSLPSDLHVTKTFDGDDSWLEISVYAN